MSEQEPMNIEETPITYRPMWANEVGVFGAGKRRTLRYSAGGLVQLALASPNDSLSLARMGRALYGESNEFAWSSALNLMDMANKQLEHVGLQFKEVSGNNVTSQNRRTFTILPTTEEPKRSDQVNKTKTPDFTPKRENLTLGENLNEAIRNIESFLENIDDDTLRHYQRGFIEALLRSYQDGYVGGYIHAATGSGKSRVAAKIIQAHNLHHNGGKVILLNPTLQILEQNAKEIREITPDTPVSNFYSEEHDLTGDVINTTPKSFINLVRKGLLKREDIKLVICDEVHKYLGEQTHNLFRMAPNALMLGLTATPYFSPLDGFIARGIVDSNEHWTELFTNGIAEVGLEEGIESGILAKLDVHLLRTQAVIDDIDIFTNTGEYNRNRLEKHLNILSRNFLTVGMIAGVDAIPENITIPSDLIKEVKKIHEKIDGKKTAIFGIGVGHIESLAKILEAAGKTVGTIHYKTSSEDRRRILEAHKKGEIQIILGVDSLRLGWDSPETEVGIYMAPTRSGIVATQELGRILRKSEETGKEKAIAIQLIDRFIKPGQAPIIIPNLFDPFFILRGSRTGLEEPDQKNSVKKPEPLINFSGLSIDALFEFGEIDRIIYERVRSGNLDEVDEVLNFKANKILEQNPEISAYQLYRQMAENMPYFIPFEKQAQVLQAIASIDSNVVKRGKNLLVFMHLRSIMKAAEPYFGEDEDLNSDLIQECITAIYGKMDGFNSDNNLSMQLINEVSKACKSFISSRENIPFEWVDKKADGAILEEIEDYWELGHLSVGEFAEELSQKYGVRPRPLLSYLEMRIAELQPPVGEMDDQTYRGVIERQLREGVASLLENLPGERVAKIMIQRWGLDGRGERTLKQIASRWSLSPERIRQLEKKGYRLLRRNMKRSNMLYLLEYILDDGLDNYGINYEPRNDQVSSQLFGSEIEYDFSKFAIVSEHAKLSINNLRCTYYVDFGLWRKISGHKIETLGDLIKLGKIKGISLYDVRTLRVSYRDLLARIANGEVV